MAIWKVLTLFSLLTLTTQVQGQAPVSPFFLLCNYHGNGQEVGASTGEVKLSVSIHGNPDNYVPGQYYKVTITSSLNFDGFFLTGLYTISSPALQRMQALGMQGGQPVSQNLMCSIVHSHMSQSPVRETTFMWIAPPAGSGCVNFLATAMLGQQMLFKDTTVLHLCEEGAPTLSPLRPVLAELHSDSMIFRDDFDSFKSFGQDHWSSHEGVDIGTGCGSLFYGDAAVFCENTGNRRLVTAALNTTTAAVLQFFLGTGSCRGSDKDADIMVLFGLNGCQDWFILDSLPPPTNGSIPKSVLIHLPEKARGDGVCFAWSQEPTLPQKATIRYTTEATTHSRNAVLKDIATTSQTKFSLSGKVKTVPTTSFKYPPTQPSTRKTKSTPKTTTDYKQYEYTTEIVDYDEQNITFPEYTVHEVPAQDNPLADAQSSKTAGKQVDFDTVVGAVPGTFQGCWAIDHVIIVNTAHVPTSLQDTFNPINPSDWLSFPGAHFKQHCHSDDTAMVFNHKSPVTGVGSRDLDLSVPDYQKDIILAEQFEDKALPGWQVSGGNVDLTCGIIHSGSSVVFDGPGKSRRICTPDIDPRKAGNLRFHFGLGSGGCHSDDIEKAEVIIYMEDTNEHTIYIIEKLDVNSYKEPKLVSVPLKPIERHSSARICWVQKFSGGQGQNVWALDNVEILPYLPQSANTSKNKMAQFSLNLNCGNFADNNDVELKYSTNYGSTWHRLHEPCLPAQCDAEYRPLDTHFHADTYKRWRRFTTPLPYAAMVPVVRFRWEKTSSDDPNWALDNVYIGTCKEGCNGHGACLDGKCSCDFGYIGDTCESTIAPNPTILLENFDGTGLPISTGIEHILGASLSFDCDVLSTGKAAVFNLDGRREFLTAELNTTNTMYIQFNIRVGSNSPVSGCPAAEKTKELVLLDYTCNGGVTWQLLKSFNTVDYRSPMSDSVLLPNEARNTGCKFRWWQPEHSGYHQDVWALDDISINDHLFNTLHVHMNNMVDIGEQLAITNGRLSDTYCRKMKSISFIGSPTTDNVRLLTTESMHIGPGYIMQFELVMGCGLPYSSLRDNRLYLEYSTDHGIHWSLVVDPCLPPSPCDLVHQGTIYDWTQYREWTRVTVPLPTTTWGPSTRFRLRQDTWARTDTWGVARLYIGQQCPNMCHGHGECNEGVCSCDEGFEGVGTVTQQLI
ncbi:hypothetical protein DPMN_004902 [Dreissena polymorpha]|uniref:Reelin n=1 Tax=Dreissena polymorpha TaxID=45954 RepID=A0A9D4RW06_DREPO|nr:hypothetical protein DPMN_004902 [Dreissena polymorpha]